MGKLDPARLLNLDANFDGSLAKSLEDSICLIVVLALVDYSPLVLLKRLRRILNWQVSKDLLITLRDLAICHFNLRHREDLALNSNRFGIDDDTPVLKGLLGEQVMREILDGFKLLLRILAARCKHITHTTGIFTDSFRDTIDGAKLRRNVALLSVNFDDEKGLLQVGDLQVVTL